MNIKLIRIKKSCLFYLIYILFLNTNSLFSAEHIDQSFQITLKILISDLNLDWRTPELIARSLNKLILALHGKHEDLKRLSPKIEDTHEDIQAIDPRFKDFESIALGLWELGIDLGITNDFSENAFYFAVAQEWTDVIKFLVNSGVYINCANKFGWTPLHRAAFGGYTETMRCLISNGADINSQNIDGFTPLHWAAIHKQKNAVELLLNLGANKDIRDRKFNKTAAELAKPDLAVIINNHINPI